MVSVPTIRTSRKQNGKSNTLRPRYTPTAAQPYSLDSFFNRWLRVSFASVACSPVVLFLLQAEKRKPRFGEDVVHPLVADDVNFGRVEPCRHMAPLRVVLNCQKVCDGLVAFEAASDVKRRLQAPFHAPSDVIALRPNLAAKAVRCKKLPSIV